MTITRWLGGRFCDHSFARKIVTNHTHLNRVCVRGLAKHGRHHEYQYHVSTGSTFAQGRAGYLTQKNLALPAQFQGTLYRRTEYASAKAGLQLTMKKTLLALLVLGGFCGVQAYADTLLIGIENSVPSDSTVEGIGDYNDYILSLSGVSAVSLDGGGYLSLSPVVLYGATSQNLSPITATDPFWNNASLDGADYNIGYCAEVMANCATGVSGIPTVNEYLQDGGTGSSDPDFIFQVTNPSTATQLTMIAAAENPDQALSWYQTDASGNILGPGGLMFFGSANGATFNIPAGVTYFGLSFAITNEGRNFATENALSATADDGVSRYAVFDESSGVPEPGTLALFGLGALVLGIVPRLRKRQ